MSAPGYVDVAISHGEAAILTDLLISPSARLSGVQADTVRGILHRYNLAECGLTPPPVEDDGVVDVEHALDAFERSVQMSESRRGCACSRACGGSV